ncbi:MAG: enoyl-CoA hydratase-related protein [Microbacterium sp.]
MSDVLVVRHGAVAEVRLDRPPVNAFGDDASAAIQRVAQSIMEDDTVRSVLLWGGEKHFAAGADVAALAGMGYEEVVAWNARLQASFSAVAMISVPVVAVLTGFALGGGLELALCADYRVAATTAKVGLPEVTLGIMPGSGGTQRLTRIVGRSRAKEILFSGRTIRSDEALRLGIVDEVTDADPYARGLELARAWAEGPRFALRAIKAAVDGTDVGLAEGLALERSLIAGLFATADKRIGMDSFLADGPGKAEFE